MSFRWVALTPHQATARMSGEEIPNTWSGFVALKAAMFVILRGFQPELSLRLWKVWLYSVGSNGA